MGHISVALTINTIIPSYKPIIQLTHWGRVTHICASELSILDSDNGLSPGRRQAIIKTNAGILLIWPLGTNFSEILIEINTFSFKKMHLKMLSGKKPAIFLGLNVLRHPDLASVYGLLFFHLTKFCKTPHHYVLLMDLWDWIYQWYCGIYIKRDVYIYIIIYIKIVKSILFEMATWKGWYVKFDSLQIRLCHCTSPFAHSVGH